ncbi:MAG: hypothetical protein HY542_06105 [Deltaproteobacteria bacterium]|nr:hypothetical protein [Deltaproteobacteria bacterium]
MNTLKRKQFILPQDKLDQVRHALKAKTETEAVILSLESVLRQKQLEKFSRLGGKIRLAMTHRELERMRRGSD